MISFQNNKEIQIQLYYACCVIFNNVIYFLNPQLLFIQRVNKNIHFLLLRCANQIKHIIFIISMTYTP